VSDENPVRARPWRTAIAAAVYTEIFWISSVMAVLPPALRGTWKGRAAFAFFAYGVPFLAPFVAVFFSVLEKWEAALMVAPSYFILLKVLWPYTPFPFGYMLVCGCNMWIANACGLLAGLVAKNKYLERD
jgi:hypothetical protein